MQPGTVASRLFSSQHVYVCAEGTCACYRADEKTGSRKRLLLRGQQAQLQPGPGLQGRKLQGSCSCSTPVCRWQGMGETAIQDIVKSLQHAASEPECSAASADADQCVAVQGVHRSAYCSGAVQQWYFLVTMRDLPQAALVSQHVSR